MDTDRKADQVNPKYVLRNYMSQLAIEARNLFANRRTTFTIENPYQIKMNTKVR
jgi:uncharacterized protein YdiU (UPF0061 family)